MELVGIVMGATHSSDDSHDCPTLCLPLPLRVRGPDEMLQHGVAVVTGGPGHHHLVDHAGECHLLGRRETIRGPELRGKSGGGETVGIKIESLGVRRERHGASHLTLHLRRERLNTEVLQAGQ